MTMDTPLMIVNAAWLNEQKACETDYDKFCEEWPNGAEVNMVNLNRASELRIDISWFASCVLPKALFDECSSKSHSGFIEYCHKQKLFYAEYEAKCDAYRTVCNAKISMILAGCEVKHTWTAEYETKRSAIEADYNNKILVMFEEHTFKLAPFKDKCRCERNAIIIACIREYYESKGEIL